MTKENLQRIHRIYSICLGLVIIITGVCFIVACLGIYNSGEQPFSRESVATAFGHIAIPVYVCTALTIVGIVFDVLSPTEAPKNKPVKPYVAMLNKAYSSKDLTQCDNAIRSQIQKEQNSRKIHTLIRTVLLCVASVIFLVYGTNSDNFHQTKITDSMIDAMLVLLPCLVVCFAYGLFTVIYNEKSMARELELLKSVPAKAVTEAITTPSDKADSSNKLIFIVRAALLIIGVFILVYGFITGGTVDVLTKAINICTECIGLG